jgi:hypothetical protein
MAEGVRGAAWQEANTASSWLHWRCRQCSCWLEFVLQHGRCLRVRAGRGGGAHCTYLEKSYVHTVEQLQRRLYSSRN